MNYALTVSRRFAIAAGLAAAVLAVSPRPSLAQATRTYEQVADWAQLPAGTTWQDMMAVDIAANGDIYALQRTPFQVMIFDAKGKFLRSWNDGSAPRARPTHRPPGQCLDHRSQAASGS